MKLNKFIHQTTYENGKRTIVDFVLYFDNNKNQMLQGVTTLASRTIDGNRNEDFESIIHYLQLLIETQGEITIAIDEPRMFQLEATLTLVEPLWDGTKEISFLFRAYK